MKQAVLVAWLAVGLAAAQYGLPPTKGKKHRTTTTTTEGPDTIGNEISAPFPFPDKSFSTSAPAAPSSPVSPPWWAGPGSPFKPGAQPAPTGCGGGPGSCGGLPPPPPISQGVPQPSPPDTPGKPVDIAHNPFLSSAILGKPIEQSPQGCGGPGGGCQTPGVPNQPTGHFPSGGSSTPPQYPGQPSSSSHLPGQPSGSSPFPSDSNKFPGQPTQPAQPFNPGQPIGSTPFPGQQPLGSNPYPGQPSGSSPFPSGSNTFSGQPNQPAQPFNPGQPSGSTPFPGQQPLGSSPYPGQPSGSSPFPSNSNQFPGQPTQPARPSYPGQPIGSSPFPGQKPLGSSPYYPGQPSGSSPFPSNSNQFPGQPTQPAQSSYPGQPIGSSPFPGQPSTGSSPYPGQPSGSPSPYGTNKYPGDGGKPIQPLGSSSFPGQQPINTPFSAQPAVPLRPVCTAAGHACVPSNMCVGGLISPNGLRQMRDPQIKECIPGLEACCRIPPGASGSSVPGASAPTPGYTFGPVTQRPYTGPLNTTPFPGCAAALKCVAEVYCTAEGVMSDSPVILTREQAENKVPLTDCQDLETGIIGKCCRDPNYKDPWPAGMMMKNQGDFDDGQYHGEGSGPIPHVGQSYNSISSTPQTPSKDHGPKPSDRPGGLNKPFPPPFPGSTPTGTPYQSGQSRPGPVNPSGFNPQNQPDKQYQPGKPSGFPYQSDQPSGSPYRPGAPNNPSGNLPGNPNQPNQPGFPNQPGQNAGLPNQQGQPSVSPYQPGFSNQPVQPGSSFQPGQPTGLPNQPGQPARSSNQPGSPFQPGQPDSLPNQPGQPSGPLYQPGSPNGLNQPSSPGSDSYEYGDRYHLPTHPGHKGQPPLPGSSCGVRRTGSGGGVAGFAEIPWQALVMSAGNRSLLCGAAIIADNAVITVAHCVNQLVAADLLVKAGEWKLLAQNPKPVQVRPVAAIARHPGYDSNTLTKDLAILILAQPFVFDTHVDKICIPPQLGSEYFQRAGQNCIITGWGKNALKGPAQGSDLNTIDVMVIPAKQCEAKLKTSQNLGKYFILNEGFSCALPPTESDLCKVDFGSAVACEREDQLYELAGVNSWDIACPTTLPTVFATSDAQWISTVLATPTPVLQAAEQNFQQNLSKGESIDGVDTEDKPGFSQGYGK